MTDGGIIEAVVQVGAQETHYLRCGRGDRVVVVLTGDAAERLRLMCQYADGGRVIAPVPPMRDAAPDGAARMADAGGAADVADAGGPADVAGVAGAGGAVCEWIRGVMDGLGLERPALVVAADLAWLADRLTDGSGEAFELLERPARQSG